MAELTPMRRQYLDIKAKNPDCLLFFRLGDFYEMFDEDAKTASRELDLTLTTRDRGKPKEEQTPMCGVPYHSCEAYIARLIAKGYKVAICEQTEDPAAAKGLVDREIIRIITPGTVIDEAMLEEGRNNYICALCLEEEGGALALCDISTGEFRALACTGEDWQEHLENELGACAPREAVLSPAAWEEAALMAFLRERLLCHCERGGEETFRLSEAREQLQSRGVSISGQGEETGTALALRAAGGLLAYLLETQKTELAQINQLALDVDGKRTYMELDLNTRRNLELTETLRGKEKRGSLLWVLDKTKTAMGHRLIRSWLERPLLQPAPINRRLEGVRALVEDTVAREEMILCLREVTDLERLISRIVYGTAGGKDLVALAAGLERLPRLRALAEGLDAPILRRLAQELSDLPQLRELISSAIVDEPPFSVREGGIIQKGYDAEVDRLRDIQENGTTLVNQLGVREKEKYGIKTLRVGFNKVFGYYIEVPKSQTDLVPDTYVRKQTTVNTERYISPELKDMEHTILTAKDRVAALEYQIFCQVKEAAAAHVKEIQAAAEAVAGLDVLTSFAAVAVANHYVMPQVDDSDRVEIREGRHPVVEKMLKDSLFVPNDTVLDCGENTLSIITGPNMAGKSTYMRQVALICLMAQMGSFVPARSARMGVVDRVFTRIGASDDLSAGQSTFMVEMSEVADILKRATSRSLLILDEIGRGTSTYDGMSIARAVLEYCADKKRLGAKTLFATHYHELTVLEGQLDGVKNYNIAAKKRADDIIFLRKIVRGGADQSYGIEVAKLAGVPERVISRARSVLEELEAGGAPAPAPAVPKQEEQVSLLDMGAAQAAQRLRAVDINVLTPIEAMNLIFELKQKL